MLKRLILALCIAAGAIILVALAASLFLDGSPNRARYEVYVDAQNRIFINGERGTEDRVYDLAGDMTVDFHLERHPDATLGFCFRYRGCDRE
ncbi:hypothetical protein IMCC21906_03183 [Spongiibacter sp. IMCC21906]|jgi:hypothetical protein|uniref:hypothetical protein n=1 Tax=Spongiibacter sp. IMCC21906 TaxID=1620392 RepID=UPI00062DDFA1|nr:hypothetical protein [Spongiibacter sp. IMCC21906]AKH70820.1 hypothetical protein IMCC21906_03183 [Spongiibacter sp. IMCC21906]